MNLHSDRAAFELIIDEVANSSGVRRDVLEKDYYVNASLKFNCLPKGETEENRRGSITCLYVYDSLYQLDDGDALQRFGKVKVEATSFTVSEPTQGIEIAPHLYELCGEDRRKILRENYGVQPFIVQTISLERIFIDKVFVFFFY